jgi:hypothetical protein
MQYSLPPSEGFVLTHFLTVADVKRSADFYSRVLGGSVVREGEPSVSQADRLGRASGRTACLPR